MSFLACPSPLLCNHCRECATRMITNHAIRIIPMRSLGPTRFPGINGFRPWISGAICYRITLSSVPQRYSSAVAMSPKKPHSYGSGTHLFNLMRLCWSIPKRQNALKIRVVARQKGDRRDHDALPVCLFACFHCSDLKPYGCVMALAIKVTCVSANILPITAARSFISIAFAARTIPLN